MKTLKVFGRHGQTVRVFLDRGRCLIRVQWRHPRRRNVITRSWPNEDGAKQSAMEFAGRQAEEIKRWNVPTLPRGTSGLARLGRVHLYVVFNPDTGLLKIGTTGDLDARLRALRCQSGSDLQLLGSWASTIEQEQRLHRRFAMERVRGEWFRLSQRVANWLTERGLSVTQEDGFQTRKVMQTVMADGVTMGGIYG